MFMVNITLKFFASGSYTVIYIYANELFPTEARNTGIGICSMVSRVGAIVGTLSNDLLVRISISSDREPMFARLIESRHGFGYIFLLLLSVSPRWLLWRLPHCVLKHRIDLYLKRLMMSNALAWLCKYFLIASSLSLFYFFLIVFSFVCQPKSLTRIEIEPKESTDESKSLRTISKEESV